MCAGLRAASQPGRGRAMHGLFMKSISRPSRLRAAARSAAWLLVAALLPQSAAADVAGAKPGGAKPGGVKPGGAKPGGAKPGGAKPDGAKPSPKPTVSPGVKLGARPILTALPPAPRWTAATPDEMAALAIARAKRGGDDALSALVTAASLDDRASQGLVRAQLASFAAAGGPLADEARWLGRLLTPAPKAAVWPGMTKVELEAPPDPEGLAKNFAILGPFQDTGGGLSRREGPEAPGQSFADTSARYS